MAKNIFLKNMETNQKPALIFALKLKAQDREIFSLILKGFDLLEQEGIPFPLGSNPGKPFEADLIIEKENGDEFKVRLELIKPLNAFPVYEMRIDYHNRYIRFIYFPYTLENQNYYCFYAGFEKLTKHRGRIDPTNHYRDLAKNYYESIKRNEQLLKRQL